MYFLRKTPALVAFACLAIGQLQAADVTVVFRYDDYSAASDTAIEVRLVDAFSRRHIPFVVGVIPCVGATDGQDGSVLPSEKVAILREAVQTGTVDVTMHGYSHQKTGPWTEFAGLPYDEQLQRLERGRALLEDALGVQVTTFVPPYNAYDEATLRAMEHLRFTCLSAGKLGFDDERSLCFLPSTCGLANARRTIESARQAPSARIVVILFHPYDFLDANKSRGFLSWPAFEQLLDWIVSQENVTVRSVTELVDSDTDLSLQRFAANKRLSWTPDYIPSFLIRLFGTESYAYLSTSEARNFRTAKIGLYIVTTGFYGVLISMGITMAIMLRKRAKRPLVLLLRYAGIVLLAAVVVYGCRDLTLGYRGALLISVVAGVCLGLCVPISSRVNPAT
jgi:peptidoglycan/xylan/chitin deacetylase (PgdA/CDA1 family)